ncbi:MAG TPA: RNA methyltransferase [Myxococcales bacterium]|nr:RNA methyltransferase [Myxococcales bacterium]
MKTASDAMDLLRRERVITLARAPGLRSLVGEIAGDVRGSWWAHPKGGLIFSIASALEDSPEVLGAKLVRGKVAFVHRDLWPQLVRVVLDPGWRRTAATGLTAPAKQLLREVERKGKLRLDGRAPARAELEKRALVVSASEHTESGRHAVVLRSWSDWAPEEALESGKALDFERARAELRSAGLTL